jgi:hypothetical protein
LSADGEIQKENTMYDFIVTDGPSIFLVRPTNDAAKEWIAENVQEDAQFLGDASRSSIVTFSLYLMESRSGLHCWPRILTLFIHEETSMGAGISEKDLRKRLYNALKAQQRDLIRAGVPTLYKNLQLSRTRLDARPSSSSTSLIESSVQAMAR